MAHDSKRPSPKGKKVSLFVTCMIDMMYPETGMSVVNILEHLGIEVDFPMAQTCCGQPAYNSGYRSESKQVAIQFLKAFKDSEVIVTPSGSCAAMVLHEYPVLFEDDPQWKAEAERIVSITWEFTEFLVDGLGITDLKARLPQPTTFAFHDSCHGMRLLGLGQAARTLLGNVENATIAELNEHEVCCGFGGLFSVKMADVSGAMLQKKVNNINASAASIIITGDSSCLTQMNGGLSRKGSSKKVRHIADILAEGLVGEGK
ncbi:MAG: lactate utilization protein A [Chloroflexota bacterium]|nr:(Fe-S)-binding protein [Chloroflexota bacterium]NOG62667.1 (Fe-S)-binding protein [Chloroflexota bacterium]GIK63124.1 MAG: lactate utilization protein A [Chloroflexota bacterium]